MKRAVLFAALVAVLIASPIVLADEVHLQTGHTHGGGEQDHVTPGVEETSLSEAWLYSIAGVVVVSLISLIGIATVSMRQERLEEALLYLVAFSAGALLGDAFLHLLPEIVAETGFTLRISLFTLSGIVVSFIVEKAVHWRHHHHHHTLPGLEHRVQPVAVMNLFGEIVHNFIDGLIIAASYLVSVPVGVATTLAVVFHEIPTEIGDFGVLVHGGLSRRHALALNFLVALTAVLGAVVALILSSFVDGLTTVLIPFSAGSFIYIAGANLIPELHKEVSVVKTMGQLFTLLGGMGVMLGLLFI